MRDIDFVNIELKNSKGGLILFSIPVIFSFILLNFIPTSSIFRDPISIILIICLLLWLYELLIRLPRILYRSVSLNKNIAREDFNLIRIYYIISEVIVGIIILGLFIALFYGIFSSFHELFIGVKDFIRLNN